MGIFTFAYKFIIILQILNNLEEISFSQLCLKLKSNEFTENYKITGVYSILRRMEKRELIQTNLTKTIPPEKIIKISRIGKNVFDQYARLFFNLEKEKKNSTS